MESLRALDYPSLPVFGVNFGTVGFLMNSHSCLESLPSILLEGSFRHVEYDLLEAKVHLESGLVERTLAFNDLVLERQTSQALRLRILVDGVLINRFAGDGLLVSTPAGSTAYNLAAGGPAVHPGVPSHIVTPLYPHRAEPFHSMEFSLVLPADRPIEVIAEDVGKRKMRVVADGHSTREVASVVIRSAGQSVTLLRTADREFSRLVSEKLIGQ